MKKSIVALSLLSSLASTAMELCSLKNRILTKEERTFLKAADEGDLTEVIFYAVDDYDINTQSAQHYAGNTGLILAINAGHRVISSLLLTHKNLDINRGNCTDHTALHMACHRQKDTSLLKEVIRKQLLKLQISKQSGPGLNALHLIACHHPYEYILSCAKLLFACDRNILKQTTKYSNSTLLHLLAERDDEGPELTHLITFLVTQKINTIPLDTTNTAGETALLCACRSGNKTALKTLLALGASTKANLEGQTPMHYACIYGHPALIYPLTFADYPSLAAEDRYKKTPFDYIPQENKSEYIAVLDQILKALEREQRIPYVKATRRPSA